MTAIIAHYNKKPERWTIAKNFWHYDATEQSVTSCTPTFFAGQRRGDRFSTSNWTFSGYHATTFNSKLKARLMLKKLKLIEVVTSYRHQRKWEKMVRVKGEKAYFGMKIIRNEYRSFAILQLNSLVKQKEIILSSAVIDEYLLVRIAL